MPNIPISFFATGEPIGQPRPRAFAKRFGDTYTARIYTPGTAEAWKGIMALAAGPHRPAVPLLGPIRVDATFWFPRPLSHYRTGKFAGQLRDNAPKFHEVKPDRDNLDKALLDTLKTLGFFRDDSQVVGGELWKLYVTGPGQSLFGARGVPGADIKISLLTAGADSNPQQQTLEVGA